MVACQTTTEQLKPGVFKLGTPKEGMQDSATGGPWKSKKINNVLIILN